MLGISSWRLLRLIRLSLVRGCRMRRGRLLVLLAWMRHWRIWVTAKTGLGKVEASVVIGSWTQTRHIAWSGPAEGPVGKRECLNAKQLSLEDQ